MIPFEELPDYAKLWSYQSDRQLSETEKNWIREQLPRFLSEWAAHGDKLNAYGDVLGDYHLVLVVNEDMAKASGCSIDSSVRFVKQLESELKLSFFNRLKMLVELNGETVYQSYTDLQALPEDALVYNNAVSTVGEFRSSWKQRVVDFLK